MVYSGLRVGMRCVDGLLWFKSMDGFCGWFELVMKYLGKRKLRSFSGLRVGMSCVDDLNRLWSREGLRVWFKSVME